MTGVGGGESDKGGVDRGSYTWPWTCWDCLDQTSSHLTHTRPHPPCTIPYPKSPNLPSTGLGEDNPHEPSMFVKLPTVHFPRRKSQTT